MLVDPYIRLTYPASWIKRYLQNGLCRRRSGRARGLSPQSPIPLERADDLNRSRGVVSGGRACTRRWAPWVLYPGADQARASWSVFNFIFLLGTRMGGFSGDDSSPTLIQIANRLHHRVIIEVFGENPIPPDDERTGVSSLDCTRQGREGNCHHLEYFTAYRARLFEIGAL